MTAPIPVLTRRRTLGVGLAATAAAALAQRPARAQANEPQLLLDRARVTVLEFKAAPAFAAMKRYVENAYGLLIFPEVLRAGFFFGAEYGNGVLLTRDIRSGGFGEPVFLTLVGGSLGLQIGGKVSDVILTVMNPGAVERIVSSHFKLGTDASVAAGPVGVGTGGGVTAQFGEDLYAFTRSQGLYGGLSLDGTGLLVKEEWNRSYHGRAATPAQILAAKDRHSTGAAPLREALARY